MITRVFSSLSTRRTGLSSRRWLEIGLLIIILAALNMIEPLSKLWVRDVIAQNVTDQRLSHFANEIVVQTLLCRRFEKDMLLNLSDQAVHNRYRAQWEQTTADLNRAIDGFQAAAVTMSDRQQADAWRITSREYKTAMWQTLHAIDSGAISKPAEANHMLTSAKGSIRTLTDTAMLVAQTKDTAVKSSSTAVQQALSVTARTMTLFVLVGCLFWMIITRR